MRPRSLLCGRYNADYMTDRGFYFSLFDFPFEVCQNNDEAEKMILNFDDKAYFEKLNEFLKEQDFSDNGKGVRRRSRMDIKTYF